MQKYLYSFLVLLCTHLCFAQNLKLQSPTTINTLDTVVFDISQATTLGNSVEFPVYFLSDDTVYALDFSFKYNQIDFTYDSIIDQTSYITELAYYNQVDSFVRLTSYSMQQYTNDTPLVNIRFTVLSGQFCASDLNTIHVYLNGDPCTYKIITCIPNGLEDVQGDDNNLLIYPNPVMDEFTLKVDKSMLNNPATISMYNALGELVSSTNVVKSSDISELKVQTSGLSEGIYFVQIQGTEKTVRGKFVKN